MTYVRREVRRGKEERRKNSIERSGRNIANLQMWTDQRDGETRRISAKGKMIRSGERIRVQFVRHKGGIDMHEFIKTVEGNKTD